MEGAATVSYTHLDVYKRQAVTYYTENGVVKYDIDDTYVPSLSYFTTTFSV